MNLAKIDIIKAKEIYRKKQGELEAIASLRSMLLGSGIRYDKIRVQTSAENLTEKVFSAISEHEETIKRYDKQLQPYLDKIKNTPSPWHRFLLFQCGIKGSPYQDIAEQLGFTRQNIKYHYTQALKSYEEHNI